MQHTSVVLIWVTLVHCAHTESQAFQNQEQKQLDFFLTCVQKQSSSLHFVCSGEKKTKWQRLYVCVQSSDETLCDHLASAWFCISGETDAVWRLENLLWTK